MATLTDAFLADLDALSDGDEPVANEEELGVKEEVQVGPTVACNGHAAGHMIHA
jgi:hypothetical protein